jgi:hypothetical protein
LLYEVNEIDDFDDTFRVLKKKEKKKRDSPYSRHPVLSDALLTGALTHIAAPTHGGAHSRSGEKQIQGMLNPIKKGSSTQGMLNLTKEFQQAVHASARPHGPTGQRAFLEPDWSGLGWPPGRVNE